MHEAEKADDFICEKGLFLVQLSAKEWKLPNCSLADQTQGQAKTSPNESLKWIYDAR